MQIMSRVQRNSENEIYSENESDSLCEVPSGNEDCEREIREMYVEEFNEEDCDSDSSSEDEERDNVLDIYNESKNKCLFNPSMMIIGTEQILRKYNERSNNAILTEYQIKKSNIKNELFNRSIDVQCKRERNTRWISDVVNVFNSIPQLMNFSKSRLVIPEFDRIEVHANDSSELKKFIRKINCEMLGYHCNHKVMNEQCDKALKNISDLYSSNEYVEYEKFIDDLASLIYKVRSKDKYDKDFHESDTYRLPLRHEIKKIIDNVIKMNGSIAAYNAKTNPECSRCRAAVRKYEYAISEIERMRSEIKQLHKELSKPDEKRYDVYEFLMKNYPTIDKVPLSDVKKRYKAEFGVNLKLDDLGDKVSKTKLFKISNYHNIRYMVRL